MEPFKVEPRIEATVRGAYRCPRISEEWVKKMCREIVETQGGEADFTITRYCREVEEAIISTSFRDIAVPGTGLPSRINRDRVNCFIDGPIILELVHMTDIGVSAVSLERVCQEHEHRILLDRIAHTGSSEGQSLREMDWLRPNLEKYPRKRLKLFLSDGFLELQAIELEKLPFELGRTAMGSKIRLTDVPVVDGVAYLRKENVCEIGGSVLALQKLHRGRLFEELDRRMDEDDAEAALEGVTAPERLYLNNI